eukprot:5497264-Lingulodinium_polyedra.AAC.1
MWSKTLFQSRTVPAISTPATSALSSSMASSHASSPAPRSAGPTQTPTHAAASLARPAYHTL